MVETGHDNTIEGRENPFFAMSHLSTPPISVPSFSLTSQMADNVLLSATSRAVSIKFFRYFLIILFSNRRVVSSLIHNIFPGLYCPLHNSSWHMHFWCLHQKPSHPSLFLYNGGAVLSYWVTTGGTLNFNKWCQSFPFWSISTHKKFALAHQHSGHREFSYSRSKYSHINVMYILPLPFSLPYYSLNTCIVGIFFLFLDYGAS